MKAALAAAGILLSVPCAGRAFQQQPGDAATRELIQKLMNRIASLEQRVAELEQQTHARAQAVPAPAPPATPPPPSGMTHNMPPVPPLPEGSAQPVYPTLAIQGFGDFNFAASNLHGPNGGFQPETLLSPHSGFEEGQFVLHFSSALSPRVSFFGELSFTGRADAGTGSPPATGFNAEVERAIIRFDQSDFFKVSFGRYHTPINYWNTAFHHGQWLQTTISRPEMVQFGGSFLPVHFVGALAEGVLPAGGLNLNYDVGLGNGRGQVISRPGDFGDVNNNRAWLVNLFVRPDPIYALQVGGSVYRDQLNPLGGPAANEWIESGHIVWHRETPEFIAEFANVHHQPMGVSLSSSNSQAFYIQTAYRLPGDARAWKPYYRFEYMHVPGSDVIFRLLPSFTASTAGVRYDITSFAAFKLEYRHYGRRNLPAINGAFSQVAFTF